MCFNCTFMELKYGGFRNAREAAIMVLIVPLWN